MFKGFVSVMHVSVSYSCISFRHEFETRHTYFIKNSLQYLLVNRLSSKPAQEFSFVAHSSTWFTKEFDSKHA